jgi:hypothetical protein
MRDILDKRIDDYELTAAKKAIIASATVVRILRKQNPRGYWEQPDSPYLPKYRSSYWTIMILSLLGMDRTNKQVARACDFIFKFQQAEGGFASESTASAVREYGFRLHRLQKAGRLLEQREFVSSLIYESQLSCLTGNMVASLIRIGYADDPRVKKSLEWLVRIQNRDGGWLCPYWKAHIRDKHGCFMGTICPMEAFSEVPRNNQPEEVKETISKGAEFLLMHHLFKAEHHGYEMINPAWLKLSFPWFAGYNILRGLDVLTKLGYVKDKRLDDAVETLLQKRQENGAWILENSPTGRMQTNIEAKGRPSKWITLIALRVLKRISEDA